jgi:hypothetical protein
MSISLGALLNGFANSVLHAPIMRKIAENPVYTAFAIVFVIVIIILLIFKDHVEDDSLFNLSLRTGFWAMLTTVFVVFLHNKVLDIEKQEKSENAFYGGVFEVNVPPRPGDVARV